MDKALAEITHFVTTLITRFEPTLQQYGYPGVFGSVLVEGFGIPAPGQSMLVVGALLAGRGDFNIVGLLMLAWSATILGNIIGYGIGRRGGRTLLFRIGVNRRHLDKVDGFFLRYGSAVIIVSRFVEGLRQFSAIAAGSMKMPWWPFFITTVIGATLWVGVWGAGTYFLEEHFHTILHGFKQFESSAWIATLLLLATLAVYLFWRRSPKG